jgi:four helix bundle protein
MNEIEFKQRTKEFAHRACRLAESLPRTRLGNIIADQLIRASTSTASHYRAACRARSVADFRNKIACGEEECDESMFWIEFARDHGLVKSARVADLLHEANEILSMLVASRRTAERRERQSKIDNAQPERQSKADNRSRTRSDR